MILGQFEMKFDTRSFPGINMVEGHRDVGEWSARHRLDFSFDVNMAGPLRHRDEEKGASPRDRPRKGEKKYITEEQVRHMQYQRPHLLKNYEYQYRQRCQYESEDEEYEHHTGKSLKKREDSSDHWNCPFFKYCWNSSMS